MFKAKNFPAPAATAHVPIKSISIDMSFFQMCEIAIKAHFPMQIKYSPVEQGEAIILKLFQSIHGNIIFLVIDG